MIILYEPKEPIDKRDIYDGIQNTKDVLGNSGELIYYAEAMKSDAEEALKELERTREYIESLKDWGKYWQDKYEELKKEKK